jgi:LysR family transcriptional regulator for metE and metH
VGRLQLFLGKLHERGQTAHAEVNHLLSVEQLRRLRTGDLDLAIIHRTEEGADIETEPLFRGENLKMLLGADHRLAERARVRPEDIRDEVLFVLPRKIQPRLYDLTMNLLHDHGYSFRDVREVGATDPRDVIQAVVAESGVTVAPAWFHPDDPAEGVVAARPLEPPVLGPDIAVAWLANPPARLTSVAQAAREIARELYLTRR